MNNAKGLGRGLEALFNSSTVADPAMAAQDKKSERLREIPTADIIPNPGQPRSYFDEESLDNLAASIKEKGVLQPLLVRPGAGDGQYELIAGERRLRAAQKAQLQTVPALVMDIDDRDACIISLMENIQRVDLNPIEEARAYQSLQDAFHLTQDELGERLGKYRGTISNSLRLLKLDAETQQDLIEGKLTAGHARCLLAVPAGEPFENLKKNIMERDLSVRAAEAAAAMWKEENRFPWDKSGKTGPELDDIEKISRREIEKLADQIGRSLSCKTSIRGNINKGKISLKYDTNEQLFEILEKLGLSLTD